MAAPAKQLTIGLNIPQTGPYSDQGADQKRAYDLAIDEVNSKGGIMGMQVVSTVGDDQTKADVARDNAQRMIERDGAVMITGGSSTGTALAVSALCQSKHTIFMATLTHGDETTNQNCHKVTFRRYNDAYMSAQSMARRCSRIWHRQMVSHHGRLLMGTSTTTTLRRSSSPRAEKRSRTFCSSWARRTSPRRWPKRRPPSPTCCASPNSARTWRTA